MCSGSPLSSASSLGAGASTAVALKRRTPTRARSARRDPRCGPGGRRRPAQGGGRQIFENIQGRVIDRETGESSTSPWVVDPSRVEGLASAFDAEEFKPPRSHACRTAEVFEIKAGQGVPRPPHPRQGPVVHHVRLPGRRALGVVGITFYDHGETPALSAVRSTTGRAVPGSASMGRKVWLGVVKASARETTPTRSTASPARPSRPTASTDHQAVPAPPATAPTSKYKTQG